MDFFRRQNWDIVGRTSLWFIISAIVIAISLGAWITRGLNWGIDFTGGSLLRYQFERPLAADEAEAISVIADTRGILEGMGLGSSQIQVAGGDTVIIRTPEVVENDAEARERDDAIHAALDERFAATAGASETLGRETVGPVIGEMLTRSAIQALVLGIVLILLYITVRYEFRFGVAAVVALIHDTLVLIGFMAILQTELNTWFVAAVLTVLGYSINDTVIIFDRIRENRNIHRRAPLDDIVNTSLLQTMARSLNTTLTTLFTLIALYVFGGPTIAGFALALIIGIAAGAYSSIFNASPLVALWYRMADQKQPGRGRRDTAQRRVSAAETADTAAGLEAAVEEEPTRTRPSARQTIQEAERAAQEEKREKRRERRKQRTDKSGRSSKRRF